MIFKAFWPEVFLSFFLIKLLILDSQLINKLNFNFPILNVEIFVQISVALIFVLLLLSNNSLYGFDYNYCFTVDYSGNIIKFVFITVSLLSFIIIWRSFNSQKLNFFEYFIILLIAILSLLLLVNASNLISIYLCLELQAISFYILASFHRDSIFSSEAGLKYFISSSVMSAIFLLGSALIYGSLGTLNLHDINILLFQVSSVYQSVFLFTVLGIFLILSTFLFKLVIAPYHFWFPQIYDGAPLGTTIIFSILPKIILFSLLIKFWVSVLNLLNFASTIIFFIGMYSIFFGIIKLFQQKRLKKLYIYSSIGQIGLPLCALPDNSLNGISSIFFFLVIYLITSILMWGILNLVQANQFKISKATINPTFLTIFNNLFVQNSILALYILILFFSLAAIPPFSGFFAKFYIYLNLIQNLKYEAAIIILYISVLGVYYYIKFLKIIFFENLIVQNHLKAQSFFTQNLLIIDCEVYTALLFLLLFLCFYPSMLTLNCFKMAFLSF